MRILLFAILSLLVCTTQGDAFGWHSESKERSTKKKFIFKPENRGIGSLTKKKESVWSRFRLKKKHLSPSEQEKQNRIDQLELFREPKKGFWGKVKSKVIGDRSPLNSVISAKPNSEVYFIDAKRAYQKALPLLWDHTSGSHDLNFVWFGKTYRDVPYTQKEFDTYREKLVLKEIKAAKEQHKAKKRLLLKDDDSIDDEILDPDILDDIQEDLEEGSVEEDLELLKDFDETSVRRIILNRTYIPTSRAVETEAVYIQLKNKDLHCVELKTGITVWVINLRSMILEEPSETKKSILFVSDGYLHSIDKATGLLLHRSLLDRAALPVPFATGDSIYLASFRQRVFSWDIKQNIPLWFKRMSGEIALGVFGNKAGLLIAQENGVLTALTHEGDVRWTFANQGTNSERVYLEKLMRHYRGSIHQEKTHAKEEQRKENRKKISVWMAAERDLEAKISKLQYRVKGKFLSRPIQEGEYIYLSSTDYNVYKLNRYTGIPEWQYTCLSELRESPVVDGNTVWQLDQSGVLHGIDNTNGEVLARIPGVAKTLASHGGATYYVTKEGTLQVRTPRGTSRLDGLNRLEILINAEQNILVSYQKNHRQIYVYDLTPVK